MKQKKRIIIISFVVLIIAIVGIIIFAQSKNKNTVQTISPIQ